jgi:hypothetical protein
MACPRRSSDAHMTSDVTRSEHVHEDEDMPHGKLLAPAIDRRRLLGREADRRHGFGRLTLVLCRPSRAWEHLMCVPTPR